MDCLHMSFFKGQNIPAHSRRILAFPGSVQGTGKFLLLLSILGKLRVELGWSKNLSDYKKKKEVFGAFLVKQRLKKNKKKQHLAPKEVALVQQYIQNYSFRDNTLNPPMSSKILQVHFQELQQELIFKNNGRHSYHSYIE